MSEDIDRDPLLRLWALLYTKIHRTYSIAGSISIIIISIFLHLGSAFMYTVQTHSAYECKFDLNLLRQNGM